MIIRKYNIHICYFTKLSLAYQIKFVSCFVKTDVNRLSNVVIKTKTDKKLLLNFIE